MDRTAARWAPRLVLLAGFLLGTGWFVYFYALGLTTAHYDAKAHLLVARRLLDSTSPGYLQLGVHWLPLLHILYLPLVIFEGQYRTGFLPQPDLGLRIRSLRVAPVPDSFALHRILALGRVCELYPFGKRKLAVPAGLPAHGAALHVPEPCGTGTIPGLARQPRCRAPVGSCNPGLPCLSLSL